MILLNMPVARDYFDNLDSLDDYEAYLKGLLTVANGHRIPLWDLQNDEAAVWPDLAFEDLNQLNRGGAAALSQLLGQRFVTAR